MIERKLTDTILMAMASGMDTETVLHTVAGVLREKRDLQQGTACSAETVAGTDAEFKAVQDCAYGLHNKRADAMRRARR